MKPKARDASDAPLFELLDELLALDPSPRAAGSSSLRARLVSRLYFAGFQVVEEIGNVGERTVPFVLGVKGRPRSSDRAVLVAATLRPGAVSPSRSRAAAEGLVSSGRLPAGVAGVACALEAMARLREAEVNRPLVFLVAFDEAARGSALHTARARYGFDVSTALLLHPTAGGVALASPGVAAVDVALRHRQPAWQVDSLAHTTRVRARGERAIPSLLAALARLACDGARVFDLAGSSDDDGEASGLLASGTAPGALDGLELGPARPERVGYPFGPEVVGAHEVARALLCAFPAARAVELGSDHDTLRLGLRLPVPAGADLAATDVELERVIGGLPIHPDLELEVTPRLHRPPFVAGARARDLLALKAPGLETASSPLASEAGFAGTPDVLLLGPEAPGQGDTLPRERVVAITALMSRLLTRLLS